MMGTKRKLPFGYKMESGRIAVDATESHWVSHLFSRYNNWHDHHPLSGGVANRLPLCSARFSKEPRLFYQNVT